MNNEVCHFLKAQLTLPLILQEDLFSFIMLYMSSLFSKRYLGAVVNNISNIHRRHGVCISVMPVMPNHLPLFISRVPLQNFISSSEIT